MSGERRRAIEARVAAAAARLEKEGRYTATRRCIQHGKVSVYAHCVSVADTACVLAETLHLHVNERALIRGALLHDYFCMTGTIKPTATTGTVLPTQAPPCTTQARIGS